MAWWDDENFFGQKKGKVATDDSLLHKVGHMGAVLGERASQVVPDIFGAAGDLASDVVQGGKNIVHGALSPNASGYDLFKGMSLPGSGELGQRAKKNYRGLEAQVLGANNVPQAENDAERYAGSAAEMAANYMTGGGELKTAAALGGAAGLLQEGAADALPNNQLAQLIAVVLPGLLHGGMTTVKAVQSAKKIASGVAHPAFMDVLGAVVRREGGGTLENPKVNPESGAMGPMQVMMATAKKPGYGIRPWDGKSQADLARVGRDKLAVLTHKYDGDVDKTLAAYNWGEGNVDKAVKAHGAGWLDHAPPETQHYVNTSAKELGGHSTGDSAAPAEAQSPVANDNGADPLMQAKVQALQSITAEANDNTSSKLSSLSADELHARTTAPDPVDWTTPHPDTESDMVPIDVSGPPSEPGVTNLADERVARDAQGSDQFRKEQDAHSAWQADDLLNNPPIFDSKETLDQHMAAAKSNQEAAQTIADDAANAGNEDLAKQATYTANMWETVHNDLTNNHPDLLGGDTAPPTEAAAPTNADMVFPLDPNEPTKLPPVDAAAPTNDNAPVEAATAPPEPLSVVDRPMNGDGSGEPPRGTGGDNGGTGDQPPPPPEPPATDPNLFERLKTALDESKPGAAMQAAARSTERSKRLSAVMKARATLKGVDRVNAMRGALKGELPNVDFPSIRENFSPEDIATLHDHINNHPSLHGYDPVNASEGLDKLLDGKMPQDSELRLLYRVLPADLMESIMKKRAVSWQETAIDIANIPRSLMSSMDVSAPGRQGIVLIGTKAYWTSFAAQFKGAWSAENARAIDESITSDPLYALSQEAGLYHAEQTDLLGNREEAFKSPMAEKIPVIGRGVKMSERAYVSYLNKLRFDHFKNVIGRMQAAGEEITPAFTQGLAEFINVATGRGNLGKLEKAGDVLNATFFSPKLMASRAQLVNPLWYAKLYRQDPRLGKEAIKSVMTFAGIMGTLLTAADKSGFATVETDPRSSDGYKLKIGPARIDVSGGILPFVRLLAMVSTNSKVDVNGNVVKFAPNKPFASRMWATGSFFRAKESPMASFVHDWYSGTDFLGRETTAVRSIGSRIAPMVVSDIADALSTMGPKGLWLGVPSAAGLGVSVHDDANRPPNRHSKTQLEAEKGALQDMGVTGALQKMGLVKPDSPTTDEFGSPTSAPTQDEGAWWSDSKFSKSTK